MKNKKLKNLSFAAMFAGLTVIFIVVLKIPNPIGGYEHLGDSVILLLSTLLGQPYAFFSAAIGGALADLISGYPVYILPTFLIKGLMTLLFTSKKDKILCKRNVIAMPLSCLLNTGLYFVAKYVIYYFIQNQPAVAMTKAVASLPLNLLQGVSSCVVFVLIALIFDKTKIKNKYFK